MDILIIAQYLGDLENIYNTNGRFIYLANLLSKNNENRVEIVTTNFLHGKKNMLK